MPANAAAPPAVAKPRGSIVNGPWQEEGERSMVGRPDTAKNWRRAGGACLLSAWLLAGSASAYDFDDTTNDAATTPDGYGGRGVYLSDDPDYGGLRLLDPGYAFSLYDVYGYPDAGVRDYGWNGNYGYPGYGDYGGYGPVTRGYSSPSYDTAPNPAAANRAYIRQLEERIRKLELANKQRQLPPYGERPNPQSWPSFTPAQPGHAPPAAGQFGQQPAYPTGGSADYGGHSEYPTFQPSYGVPPTYQFR